MRVNVVTNLAGQKGLYRDARLLERLLQSLGHEVRLVQFDDHHVEPGYCNATNPPRADLTIHLEVVREVFFKGSPRHWWIPNPEWAETTYLAHVERFEHVLCKTRDGERALRRYASKTTVFTGFMSEDRLDPDVPRQRAALHAHRFCIVKGTDAVLGAWAMGGLGIPLREAGRFPDDEYQRLQNECLFHVCPSEYEGWGHCIHEGLSVGAIVVTTDAPPMSEFAGIAKTVPVVSKVPRCLGMMSKVDAQGVHDAVQWCLGLTDGEIAHLSEAARDAYRRETEHFQRALRDLLA